MPGAASGVQTSTDDHVTTCRSLIPRPRRVPLQAPRRSEAASRPPAAATSRQAGLSEPSLHRDSRGQRRSHAEQAVAGETSLEKLAAAERKPKRRKSNARHRNGEVARDARGPAAAQLAGMASGEHEEASETTAQATRRRTTTPSKSGREVNCSPAKFAASEQKAPWPNG